MGISSFHPHGEGGAACIFHLTCGHAEVPRGQETTCSQQRFSSCWSGVWGQGPVHPARSIIECRQPRFQWVGGGVGVFLHLNSPDSVFKGLREETTPAAYGSLVELQLLKRKPGLKWYL